MGINPQFKIAFLTVTIMAVSCLLGIFLLAIFGSEATDVKNIPVMQTHAQRALNFGWQTGFGAIIGLMGGKITA